MRIHYLTSDAQIQQDDPHVMAIGFFDGVHLGHQELFKEARKWAERKGVTCSALTFSPHPNEVIFKEKDRKYITPLRHKLDKIATCGIDTTYVMKFDTSFASLSPDEFVQRYIIQMNVKHVVVGFDFTFGHKAKGDITVLKEQAEKYQFGLSVIPKKTYDQLKISSTITRELVRTGKVDEILPFLGEYYKIESLVAEQNSLNRYSIVVEEPFILPESGMYEVDVFAHNETYKAELSVRSSNEHELMFERKAKNVAINSTVTIRFLQRTKVKHALFA